MLYLVYAHKGFHDKDSGMSLYIQQALPRVEICSSQPLHNERNFSVLKAVSPLPLVFSEESVREKQGPLGLSVQTLTDLSDYFG